MKIHLAPRTALVILSLLCLFAQAADDRVAVKPPKPPPDVVEKVVEEIPPEPVKAVRIEVPEKPRPASDAEAAAQQMAETLHVKEAELKRLNIRLESAKKRNASVLRDWADPEKNRNDNSDDWRKLRDQWKAAVDEIRTAELKVWDADDEIQALKNEPYHARVLQNWSGRGGYRSANFTVAKNPVGITWEAQLNSDFELQIVNGNGTPVETFTTRRGQRKIRKPGVYYVEITSKANWSVALDRLNIE